MSEISEWKSAAAVAGDTRERERERQTEMSENKKSEYITVEVGGMVSEARPPPT